MKKDLHKKSYFYDTARFADLINGVLCSGRQILLPSDLTDMDSQTGQFDASAGQAKQQKRLKDQHRDLIRKAAFGVNFIVLGIENQEEVNYLMPLRCMSYDVEEYERQTVLISKQVRQRKDITGAEFISGFAKDSHLSPCVTLVLYYGNEWDGATDLYGILDFTDIPEELKDKVNNYKICICEVRKFEDTDVFRTDIKQVFDCIRYSEDPEKLYELVASDSAYREMDGDTYDLIAQYTKTNELMQVKRCGMEEEKVDMCRAITELIERGRSEGRMEGKMEGKIESVLELLEELGNVPRRIVERIRTEDNPDVLSRWHKAAAKSGSIAEFETNM